DQRVRQLRAADAIRVHDVRLSPPRADDLPPREGGLKRLPGRRIRRFLEKQGEEMAGITLGFPGEGIVGHDLLPFRRSSHEEVGFEAEAGLGLRFEPTLEAHPRPTAPENQVAALK